VSLIRPVIFGAGEGALYPETSGGDP